MDWAAKLERLQAGRSKRAIEKLAGWSPNTLVSAAKEGRRPNVVNAMQLAEVLGVPVTWLFDDDQDWPPPPLPAVSPGAEALERALTQIADLDRSTRGLARCLAALLLVHRDRLGEDACVGLLQGLDEQAEGEVLRELVLQSLAQTGGSPSIDSLVAAVRAAERSDPSPHKGTKRKRRTG